MPRAFLFVTPGETHEPSDDHPIPLLLPLVDRPFLQHVVEHLATAGIDALEVITGKSESVEALVGDGSRWGFRQVNYHHVKYRATATGVVQKIAAESDATEFLLLAHADRLPIMPIKPYLASGESFVAVDAATGDWTGWALADAARLALPETLAAWEGEDDAAAASAAAAAMPPVPTLPVATTLSAQTLRDLLRAQKTLLDQAHPGLLRTGREIEPGIHLSRNVVLHHTAVIHAPIFIGQDCRIAAGAEIGPYAVIGDGCIVDEGASVAESLVLAGSYIGEEVEIHEAVVDRNHLMSVRFGESVDLTGEFLLGDLSNAGPKHGLASLGRSLSRLLSWRKAGT